MLVAMPEPKAGGAAGIPIPPGRLLPPVCVFWLAQLTRIARDPNHWPFIVLIACSASALSLEGQHPADGEMAMASPEGQESVTSALARVHVPHDSCLAHGSKRSKCLGEYLVVHLGREVSDKDVEMMLRVLLVLLTLVGPVDSDLCVKDLSPVQRLHRLLGRSHIGVLDKAIVESTVLEISVLDNLGRDDGSGNGKDLGENQVGDAW
jgi:hypothetical protein